MRTLISIAVLSLLLAACRGEQDDFVPATPAPTPGTPAAAATPSVAPSPAAGAVLVRGTDGSEALTVGESGGVVDIGYTDGTGRHALRGEEKDSGKRKYAMDGGAVAYEIKPAEDGDGFKLRNAAGQLRWKVKVYPDKIKISDNEENKNPFELKVRDGGRVKVVAPGDREVGNVRFDSAASKIEVENASGAKQFEVASSAASGAYGVLLLDSIPQPERAILVAEILSRKR
jgi:hypothetical protein